LNNEEKINLLKVLEELGNTCYEIFGLKIFNSYVLELKDSIKNDEKFDGNMCFVIKSGGLNCDIYEKINSYHKIKSIKNKINRFDELSKDELKELKEELCELQSSLLRGNSFYSTNGFIFDSDIELCIKKLNEMDPTFSQTHIVMQESESINGYNLYDTSHDIFSLDMFESNLSIWNDTQEFTLDEFREEFSNVACTDWHKMDRFGNSYGGYWEYPEGSDEKNDAWNLTFDDNMRGLYELPYSKKFVLATVKFGCSNRMECVRYSNHLCEWFKRKLTAMESIIVRL
jgi:hypothetical protein